MVTFRSGRERLRIAEQRWNAARESVRNAVLELERELSRWYHTRERPVIVRQTYDALNRASASSERLDRLKGAQALITIGSRARIDGTSPRLAPAVEQFEAVNDRAIVLLEDTLAFVSEVFEAVRTIVQYRAEIGDSHTLRLIDIATTAPAVARELLEQQLDSIAVAEQACTSLAASFDVRAATARAWISGSGSVESPIGQSVISLIGERSASHAMQTTAKARLNNLLETHERLDPQMRVLSQRAYSPVRVAVAEASEDAFAEIAALFGQGHQALGLTYRDHQRMKKGLALIREGHVGTPDDSTAATCWQFVAELLYGPEAGDETRQHVPSPLDEDGPPVQAAVRASSTPRAASEFSNPCSEVVVDSEFAVISSSLDSADSDLEQILSRFMSRVAPALIREFLLVYDRRQLESRVMAIGQDGAPSLDCMSMLEFTSRNWSALMTRSFGYEARLAIDELRKAAYLLNAQRELFPQPLNEARAALNKLLKAVRAQAQ
jgi:hypothetical protein